MTNSNFNPNNKQVVAQNILKCFGNEIDLIKAEGSRGGKVIGHTKSGKPVYEKHPASHEVYKKFKAKDHKEAARLHNEASTESKDPYYHNDRSQEHMNLFYDLS